MKIVAMGNGTVILEATTNEVNALAGKNLYQWNSYNERWDFAPKAGTTFSVVEGVSQLHRNAKRVEEVQRLKAHLKSIIDQLDLIEPFMKEPDPAPSE